MATVSNPDDGSQTSQINTEHTETSTEGTEALRQVATVEILRPGLRMTRCWCLLVQLIEVSLT